MRLFSEKDIKRLIIPLIFEQILGVTVGMAAIAMVAGVGEAAVAGVSLVDSLNLLLIQVFASMATGGAVVASRYLGQKNTEKAVRAANQLLLSITLLSLLVMAFALIGNEAILGTIFGKLDREVMENAKVYFYLTAASFPFLAIYNGAAALCRAMGDSKTSLMTSLLMNLINICGNGILVFLLHRGADGVGTATLLSRATGAVIMLIIIHDQKRPIHIDARFRLGFYPSIIKKIFRIGIPMGLDYFIFQIGKLLVARLVASFGTAATAANAVGNTVSGFAVIPASAIGMALITIVGQTLGARAYDDTRYYIKRLMKTAHIAMAILNIGIILLSGLITGIFGLSPEAHRLARQIIISYSACAIVLWPSGFALPNVLRAADDAKYAMIVSVTSMWVLRVGLSYVFALFFHMGVIGVWVAMYVDWILRAGCYVTRVAKEKWIKSAA